MKGQIDEKLTSRWFWSKSQKGHSDRLRDIKQKYTTRIDNSIPKTQKISNASSFLKNEKKTSIYKDNLKLLGTLSEISTGRRRTSSTHSIMDSLKSIPKAKSLNKEYRQKELKRINNDNEKLAKRLLKTTNALSFKKLDEEWNNTVKYKKTISKARFRALPKLEERQKLERRNSGSKNGIQKRAQSLFEQRTLLSNGDHNSPVGNSPISELVHIEPHKPSTDFCVKGFNNRQYRKLEPIKINPPKASVRLGPLKK